MNQFRTLGRPALLERLTDDSQRLVEIRELDFNIRIVDDSELVQLRPPTGDAADLA